MIRKTIDLPEDVISIVAALDVPFSVWVVDRLRKHDAVAERSDFGRQLLADAELAGEPRSSGSASQSVVDRIERSASW